MLESTKLNGIGNQKSILISDMELQSLEFAQLVFVLALVQYFLTILPPLPFGMVMYILCHYKLEACNLFLILILKEIIVKRLHESHKRLNIGLLNIVETYRLW